MRPRALDRELHGERRSCGRRGALRSPRCSPRCSDARSRRPKRADIGFVSILPRKIQGAIWQAGITAGNSALRVFLDGEPVPSALAAGENWVLIVGEAALEENLEHGIVDFATGGPIGSKLLRGRVHLVACRE